MNLPENFDEAVKQVMGEFGIPANQQINYSRLLLQQAERKGLFQISPSSATFGNGYEEDLGRAKSEVRQAMREDGIGRVKLEEYGDIPIIYGIITNDEGKLMIHPMFRLPSRDKDIEKRRGQAMRMMEDGLKNRRRIALSSPKPHDPVAPGEIKD